MGEIQGIGGVDPRVTFPALDGPELLVLLSRFSIFPQLSRDRNKNLYTYFRNQLNRNISTDKFVSLLYRIFKNTRKLLHIFIEKDIKRCGKN